MKKSEIRIQSENVHVALHSRLFVQTCLFYPQRTETGKLVVYQVWVEMIRVVGR